MEALLDVGVSGSPLDFRFENGEYPLLLLGELRTNAGLDEVLDRLVFDTG